MSEPFAWKQAMGFGLGILRLPPDAFWRMTPRELSCAIGAIAGHGHASFERGDLAVLMRCFPDD